MNPENTPRDASQQPNNQRDEQLENQNNRSNAGDKANNRSDESISTAGDTALGKGSKTGIRKEEKEASDNYDTDQT